MGAYSKVPKGRETTDGGWTPPAPERSEEPPVIAQQHEKSRRDDRNTNNLILNRLCTLSPFQGLVLLMFLYRGFFPSVRRRRTTPPSVVYRAFGAYLSDTNNFFCKRKSYHKHLPATVLPFRLAVAYILIRESTRTYVDKYTYL